MERTVLILGATGMLGHTLLEQLSQRDDLKVYATVRANGCLDGITEALREKIIANVDADNLDSILKALAEIQPNVVINCIGIIKQLAAAKDPVTALTINSLFPHRLALVCKATGCRLIHISTDCVFSGSKGNYSEEDFSDAADLYGRTKFLGEVHCPHCVTLRTSIIGHELKGCHSLIDWFLSQERQVSGFTKAIYTGFPAVELARIIADYVIPNDSLSGLYQVSSDPITKYDLLKLVASHYGKRINIVPDDNFVCDRSLISSRFRRTSGYVPPPWHEMIAAMYLDYRQKHSIV